MTALGGRPYGSRINTKYDTEYRRPQPDGPRYPKVRFIALVQPEQHEKAHRAARAMGISGSLFMALMIDRMEVDADGRPVWAEEAGYPAPAAAPLDDGDEPEQAGHRLSA
jgi:hypothetical protein